MEFVAARLGDRINNTAGRTTEFCREAPGFNIDRVIEIERYRNRAQALPKLTLSDSYRLKDRDLARPPAARTPETA